MSLTNASPEDAARAARLSSRKLAILPVEARNAALDAIHHALAEARHVVLAANARDLEAATRSAADGLLSQSLLKRLDLSRKGKYEDMLQGILDVKRLEDPLGRITLRTELDDNLILTRRSCPIGVLLIIFEARPEVIANISSLAIKSGNAAILKGGKESSESFRAISTVISAALASTPVPNDAVQLVTTRDAIDPLLRLARYIDLVIPRGGNDLVKHCQRTAHMPVLGHADGLCHMYLHADAEPAMAARLVLDSKTDYPAACNALETLLVHRAALFSVLPPVARALLANGVQMRCDAPSHAALAAALSADEAAQLRPAAPEDYDTEFLDLILAVKTVDGVESAVEHVNAHGSGHTDAVVAADRGVAEAFMAGVDGACKFWNCSTRMSDGMRFGFGTEVGISTNKIHARGPVGLEGLTIYEYRVEGEGQCAASYGAGGDRTWKHRRLDV